MKSEAGRKTVRYDKAYAMTPDQNEWYEAMIGSTLEQYYPGYVWFVHVEKGMVYITCPYINKEKGFVYSLQGLCKETPDKMRHMVMQAGGEILERYGVSRVRMNAEEINTAERDIKGNMIDDE